MGVSLETVAAEAARGGLLDGAPDFVPLERQLDLALHEIASLHDVIAMLARDRASMIQTTDEVIKAARQLLAAPSKKERLRDAWNSLKARKMSIYRFARRVASIFLKSTAEARRKAQTVLDKRKASSLAVPTTGKRLISQLHAEGQNDRALVLAKGLMTKEEFRKDTELVTLVRNIQNQRGALTSVLAEIHHLERLGKTSRASARSVEGRLRSLSGFYPRITGGPDPQPPVDTLTILHLVKESRPFLSNGFTSRSHKNFVAELEAGLRPVVLTELGFPRSHKISEFDRKFVLDGVEHRMLDIGSHITSASPFDVWLEAFAQAAYRELIDVRPSVIHVSSGRRGYETALVGLALKDRTGLPLVYEVRSFFEGTWTSKQAVEESGEIFLRSMAVEQMCMNKADVVITLGNAMRDNLISRGTDPDKIVIVPNGVDLEQFEQGPRHKWLALALGIQDLPTYGYVSNLDHYRESQETLIRAAQKLKARGRDFRCVLVGGGPRREALEVLAKRLGVADDVVFTGPVDHNDISDYYKLIDIFVVPRINERAARFVTPLKPLEAMAGGRPVVVSDLPALREIVAPPQRGLSFRAGDADDLADTVEYLWDNPEIAARLAESGREWVASNRRWDLNGPRYVHAFEEARRRVQGGLNVARAGIESIEGSGK